MRRRAQPDEETGINITPMLDVVFILLIFFIVTTSFLREQGLDVSRSPSAPASQQTTPDQGPIVVRIDANGLISIRGRIVGEDAVHANLERERAGKPQISLVVAAHPDAETRTLVLVLDAARAVGIESVNVTTQAEQPGGSGKPARDLLLDREFGR